MTKQMQALLMVAEHPLLKAVMLPVIDVERERFHITRINYGVLSGGMKAAVSWAWCLWKDEQVPEQSDASDPDSKFNRDSGVRDPFEGFGVMNRELQMVVAKALLHRWS